MHFCKYLNLRVRRIGKNNGKFFNNFSKKKKKKKKKEKKHEETEFHNSIQD